MYKYVYAPCRYRHLHNFDGGCMDDLMTVMDWYLAEDEHDQFLDELDQYKNKTGCFADDKIVSKRMWTSKQMKLNASAPLMNPCASLAS